MKKKLAVLVILLLTLTGWSAYQYQSISLVGETSEPVPADVIIIMGAAVWEEETPSPALQARIDHALKLHREGYAERLILSGGRGIHPPTEAEAMQVALLRQGVDNSRLYLEKEATNSLENLKFSKDIMTEFGFETAIIVTDPFHMKRSLLIARDLGLEATGAPAKNSILYRNDRLKTRYTLREVLAITRYYMLRPWPK
jgi:uncharacterized SAM-binding protein YcdF (DUF218 family)